MLRLRCVFDRGFLFYVEYNLRLFFFLGRHRCDIICSVDLDTLLPALLASRWRKKTLVFDAHEFFTEMEEVVSRPLVHSIWNAIAKLALPRVKRGYTISEGYRQLYASRFGIELGVVRNVPQYQPSERLRPARTTILYQGALNIGRGLEASIVAMRELDGCTLHIIGEGPERQRLESLVSAHNLKGRVEFLGALPPDVLRTHTRQASVGLTLFSGTGLHHRHSLANRFFDYVHAGIPQVAMNYPEYAAFNADIEVAVLIDELRPETVADEVRRLLDDADLYGRLSQNCMRAAAHHNWQEEQKKLIEFYERIG